MYSHPLLPLIPADQRPEPLRRIVAVGIGLVIVSASTAEDGAYEVTSWRPRTEWEIASERNELGGEPAAAAYVSARIIGNPDDIPFAVQEAAEHLERWLAKHQVAA